MRFISEMAQNSVEIIQKILCKSKYFNIYIKIKAKSFQNIPVTVFDGAEKFWLKPLTLVYLNQLIIFWFMDITYDGNSEPYIS